MNLPVAKVLTEVHQALFKQQRAILVAPPGAGKTTQVPLYLLQQLAPQSNKRILLLEPRRLAVKNTAEYLAQQINEQPGQRIGYRMRQDSRVSSQTRLEVITEGVLLRMLQEDPSLGDIDTIIFDEFHERSLQADLGLSLCLQTNTLFRDDNPVKLLLMSATLETDKIAEYLHPAPVIISQGRQFPITYHYLHTTPEPRTRMHTWAQSIEQALSDQTGNILVFLPGQADIHHLHEKISHLQSNHIEIYPLYGRLTLIEQRQAIARPKAGTRKVVLATNIAETSLTIDGISCVIDTGLHKQALYEAGSGLTRLHTRMISAASATQRAGRAGRLQAGHCYRQWAKHQQQSLAPQTQPAIKNADLSGLVLQLLACGYNNVEELHWLDRPSTGAWQQAVKLLKQLQAVQQYEHGLGLTKTGTKMAATGLEPRLAQALITGITCQQRESTCQLISQLERPNRQAGLDLAVVLTQPLSHDQQRTKQQLMLQSRQFKAGPTATATATAPPSQQVNNWLAYVLIKSWPDRVAHKQNQKGGLANYKLANGRGVQLPWSDNNAAPVYIIACNTFASAQQNRDRVASYLSIDLNDIETALPHLIQDSATCQWNQDSDRLDVYKARLLDQLVLSQSNNKQTDPNAAVNAICQYLQATNLSGLNWTPQVQQWLARVRLLHTHANTDNNPWPDLSNAWLVEHVASWLGPYLTGINSGKKLAKLDLMSILPGLLDYTLQKQMQSLIPARITVPSGNSHSIDYSQQPPVLAVKLQELFGMQEVPKVAYKVAVQVHLLSPAGRPLQITQDLAYFWQHSYTQVKKEMKGRYPKHPWPDDPLTAIATAKTKQRM